MSDAFHNRLHRILTTSLSLTGRIYLAAVTTLLAVSVCLFSSLYAQQRVASITHEILDLRLQAILTAHRLKESLVGYDNCLFRYLATKNPAELRESLSTRRTTRLEIQRLRILAGGRVRGGVLENLHQESENYFSDAALLLDFSQKNALPSNAGVLKSLSWLKKQGAERREFRVISAEGREHLLRVFQICDELLALHQQELERSEAEMAQALEESRRIVMATAAVSGLIVLMITLGLAASLLGSLNALLQGVRRVEQSDTDFEIPVTTPDEVGELTRAFNHMARTVREQKQKLLRETITDGLTGAYNQHHFRHLLKQDVERARRSQRPVCLLMIDIDHFKNYNDTQGHEYGNEVLKQICQAIRETLREGDILARYGGDEMAVILRETPREEAKEVINRLIGAVSTHRFPGQQNQPGGRVTISVGAASFPEDALASTDLILKADKALYAAKEAGRDCQRWFAHTGPLTF